MQTDSASAGAAGVSNGGARTLAKYGLQDQSGFDSGMQKDGLTMFLLSCYSCKVPRVNPGLVWAVSFRGVVWKLALELLRNAFPVDE